MLIAQKVSLNSLVKGGSFSLKIYAMERGHFKQVKLAKTLEFELKTARK